MILFIISFYTTGLIFTSYNKQEYFSKKANILKIKKDYLNNFKSIDTKGKNVNSENVSGSCFFHSQDINNGFFGYNVKSGNNLMFVGGVNGNENMYDVFTGGAPHGDNLYGVVSSGASDNVYNSVHVTSSSKIYYSYFLNSCSYCIGCVGLKNKSYCILNKQYTKKHWEKLADQIFSQMDKDGELGDFFPGELNPFYFNDTMAGLIGNFTKEEVEKEGYMWRDEEIKVDIPDGVDVIGVNDLNDYQGYNGDGEWKINSEILKKVIKDENGDYYRIVKMEYDFLMKYSLPLPEIHWMGRMKLNLGI